jgi:hypothetical protein
MASVICTPLEKVLVIGHLRVVMCEANLGIIVLAVCAAGGEPYSGVTASP